MEEIKQWFQQAEWGAFSHYFPQDPAYPSEAWNRQVEEFDVDGLARQLAEVGARYYFITIGQNSGHYCSPNFVYDELTGITPSKCSRRDLVLDLAKALSPYKIKLFVYLPSGAPAMDQEAVKALEWEWGYRGQWPSWPKPGEKEEMETGKRLASFQKKWEAIIREWSLRWGSQVNGWWIDGCYFSKAMYNWDSEPNFQSFLAALKSGNPNAIVAFNGGDEAPVRVETPLEDFTAGELSTVFPVKHPKPEGGVLYHLLSYLGADWGSGDPRFSDEFVISYTKQVIDQGGTMTWDVPLTRGGLIAEPFFHQLKQIDLFLGKE